MRIVLKLPAVNAVIRFTRVDQCELQHKIANVCVIQLPCKMGTSYLSFQGPPKATITSLNLSKSQNGPALNAVSGPHSTFLSEIDLVQIDAPHIDPEEEYGAVFIFPIHGALADGENLYNATRKAWRVPEKYRSLHNAIAVGIKEYISLSAYSIKEWIPHNETKYEFNGKEYLELEHMNWRRIISDAMGYWQRGNYLVVSFDGNGSFRFLRGNPDREWRSIKEFVLV
jgi:hypothetical protein